jgi:hypothetical protein
MEAGRKSSPISSQHSSIDTNGNQPLEKNGEHRKDRGTSIPCGFIA